MSSDFVLEYKRKKNQSEIYWTNFMLGNVFPVLFITGMGVINVRGVAIDDLSKTTLNLR